MLTTKDLGQFLAPLAPLAASLRFVPVPGEQPEPRPARLGRHRGPARRARRHRRFVRGRGARRSLREETPPYDILICGSLYLAGEVLRSHG